MARGQTATIDLERQASPLSGSNDLLATVPIAAGRFYTVEARCFAGYDTAIPGEAVLINEVDTVTPGRDNPAHVVDADGNGNVNDAGAMWTVGETFSDATNDIRVTVVSASASGYRVTITNGCAVGQYRAEYYNNTALSGAPALIACENAPINHDWKTLSPGGGVRADLFSARWKGRFTFAEGAYTFFARADDGVRVYVDGSLVIDWWKPQSSVLRQANLTLTAGEHEVKVEYFDNKGTAVAQVWWAPVCPVEQYRAEYFNNKTLSGAPVLVRCEPYVNIHHEDWGTGSPAPGITADTFSVRWTGRFSFRGPNASNGYTFYGRMNDGMKVFVDGAAIINDWGTRTTVLQKAANRGLTNGLHEVKVEVYDNTGLANAQVWWQPRMTACAGLSLAVDQTSEGTLKATAGEQPYCFFGQAGQWVSSRMFALNGSGLDTYIKLYGPNGQLIAQDDDAGPGLNSFLTRQLPQTGMYRLVATRFGASVGDYAIRLESGRAATVGDINRDCTVDIADYNILVSRYGSTDQGADLDLDGLVGDPDYTILSANFSQTCASQPSTGSLPMREK